MRSCEATGKPGPKGPGLRLAYRVQKDPAYGSQRDPNDRAQLGHADCEHSV